MKKRDRTVVIPVGVATEAVKLLKRAAAEKSLATRLRSKSSQAAAAMEVSIRLASDGRISVPKRFVQVVLQGMFYLVRFRHEIKEAANSFMGINK